MVLAQQKEEITSQRPVAGADPLCRAPKHSALRGTKSHGFEARYLAGQGALVGSLLIKGVPTLSTQPVSYIPLSLSK